MCGQIEINSHCSPFQSRYYIRFASVCLCVCPYIIFNDIWYWVHIVAARLCEAKLDSCSKDVFYMYGIFRGQLSISDLRLNLVFSNLRYEVVPFRSSEYNIIFLFSGKFIWINRKSRNFKYELLNQLKY